MSRRTSISLPRAARMYMATAIIALLSMTSIHPSAQDKSSPGKNSEAKISQDKNRLSVVKPGRSVVRSQHAMVATSQPLASQVGLEVLKRGGNAVDAEIGRAHV